MTYMLDTDVCIYIINQYPISYLKKLELIEQNGLCQISSIVLAELYYGIANSKRKEQNQIKLNLFLEKIEIKPYNEQCAYYYGEIRADLTKKGKLIGNNDLLIASGTVI